MSMNKETMLEIRDLTIHYESEGGTVHAVEGLNLKVGRGEALGIMRLIPNPPGKITSGEILFEGEYLLRKSESEMRKIEEAR